MAIRRRLAEARPDGFVPDLVLSPINLSNRLSDLGRAPEEPSTPNKVVALLKDLLHDNPAAAKELRDLLGGEAGVQAITQTMNLSGRNNVGAQVVGSGNTVSGGRR